MNKTSNMTRRNFVKLSAIFTGIMFTGINFFKTMAARASVRRMRTAGTYKHDEEMKLRKSQDNPMVKQIYKDFLEHPNSHKAHELLHTHYTDRSAKIKALKKKGIKLNLQNV